MKKPILFNCFSAISNANINSYAELCERPVLLETLGKSLIEHINYHLLEKIFISSETDMSTFLSATSMCVEDLRYELIGHLLRKVPQLIKAFLNAEMTDKPHIVFAAFIQETLSNHITDLYRRVSKEEEYESHENGHCVIKKRRIPKKTNASQCASLDDKAVSSSEGNAATLMEYIQDESGISAESIALINSRILWVMEQLDGGDEMLEFFATSLEITNAELFAIGEKYAVSKKVLTYILATRFLQRYELLNLDSQKLLNMVVSAKYGRGLSFKTLEKDRTNFIHKQEQLNEEYRNM